MLAAVRVVAVLLGLGAGALTSTVLGIVAWLALAMAGFAEPLAGLAPAILVGFGVGGYVAGRLAVASHRFNGSLAGLALAALVVVIAVLGGSPAPPLQVLLLAGLGILIGGLGGSLGKQRKSPPG